MINQVTNNAMRFVVLVLLQVLILNNIQLGGLINPYLYVFFILLLPMEIPGWLLLVLSFLMGLTIDLFSNTIGMHAAASTFMGFLRPYVLQLLAPREGYEMGSKPTSKQFGINWFLSYASILVFFHHFLLFYLEVFRLSNFFSTFLRVILSTIVTLALVILSQFLISGKKSY